MNQKNYLTQRALVTSNFYPGFRPRDIGLYQTLFRNKRTGSTRIHNEWRPHGRPELSVNPPPIHADWIAVCFWHWYFPPALDDVF